MDSIERLKKLQIKLAAQVITKDTIQIRRICAVDISYKDNRAYCAAIVWDKKNQKTTGDSNF